MAEQPLSNFSKRLIAIIAFIGYIALFLYLVFFVGLENIWSTLITVNIGIYVLAVVVVLASITFHALVWLQLLRGVNINLGFRRTLEYYWVGIFVDNLVPGGWSGDLFKAYLLSRKPGIDGGRAVASVVAKNMYEAIFNLLNMVIGMILLFMNYTIAGSIFIGISLVMFLLTLPLVILLLVSFRPQGTKKTVRKIIQGLNGLTNNRFGLVKFLPQIDEVVDNYHIGIKTLGKNPRVFIKPMLLSFVAWGFEVLALYMVFVSLGLLISPDKVIIVRSIAANVESQGFAFVGFAQVVRIALYDALGVLPSMAASYGVLGGVVIFWLRTGISYFAFQRVIFKSTYCVPEGGLSHQGQCNTVMKTLPSKK